MVVAAAAVATGIRGSRWPVHDFFFLFFFTILIFFTMYSIDYYNNKMTTMRETRENGGLKT